METFTLYIVKSALWLTGFAAVYLLFLQNERFFSLNRLYLLSGIIVSFIFPLITIHYQVEVPAGSLNGTESVLPLTEDAIAEVKEFASATSILSTVMIILYLSGVIFLVYRIIYHLLLLVNAIRKTGVSYSGSVKLVRVSGFPSSFSFFNYIFIDPAVEEDEAGEIMNHELVHVNQNHWLDLLLCELLRIVQWMNPFIWIYSGLIRQNHEYLADRQALQTSVNPAVYRAAMINQLFSSKVISLTNSFNYSRNKKRFHMMKKIETSPFRKFKILLILPVFAIILYSFSKPEYRYIDVNENTGINDPLTAVLSEGIKAADKGTADALPGEVSVLAGESGKETGIEAEKIIPAADIAAGAVKGTIVQKGGGPLEGAVIVIRGTTTGTISDSKGFFQLGSVPDDAMLAVSYVGFKSKVLKPVFGSEMMISMEKDTIKVLSSGVGFPTPPPPPPPSSGKSTASNLSPAVRQGGDAAISPPEAKGIEIRSSSAEPVGNPLIILDDVKTDITVNSINPDLIQSITVLKGERATRLYGEEAKGGVIIITTKTGNISSGDKPEVSAGGYASGQEKQKEPFTIVEELPEFPGGGADAMRRWLLQRMKYPDDAVKAGISGLVNVVFVVDREGRVKNAKVLKAVYPSLDAEAVRLVGSMPDWKPGKQAGKTVDVQMVVPLTFYLK